MSSKPSFRLSLSRAIHETASGLYDAGAIDKVTMRTFDASCIVSPESLQPEKIKKIRESAKVSQPIFATYLNTSASTIRQWESGAKQPGGMGLKLLNIVRKHGVSVLA